MKSADRICLEGGAPCASRGRCEPQGFGGEWAEEQNTDWFRPILARTRTVHRPIGPVAYDCVKFIVVRAGSALLYCRHFKEQIISVGDVVLIGPGVLVGSEPEGFNTVTTIYLDTDYVVDQLYWQYVGLPQDRLDAQELADSLYCEPTQILRLGEERVGLLLPWLDELVALSVDGAPRPPFSPHAVSVAGHRGQDRTLCPGEPRSRLRIEAVNRQPQHASLPPLCATAGRSNSYTPHHEKRCGAPLDTRRSGPSSASVAASSVPVVFRRLWKDAASPFTHASRPGNGTPFERHEHVRCPRCPGSWLALPRLCI